MTRNVRTWVAGLLTALAVPVAGWANGDNDAPPYRKHQCPPSKYCRLNYWAPNVYRIHAYMQPIGPYILPVNTTPGLAPQYKTSVFRCMPVDPTARPYYPNLGTPLETEAPVVVVPQFGTPY